MDKKEALEAAIAKWRVNEQIAHIREANIYSDSCPLCKLFLYEQNEELEGCAGCPVSERTGSDNCKGSPWYYVKLSSPLEEFHAAARAEREFLESLREPEE